MESYRVAIVGTGSSVGNHLEAIRRVGDRVRLVAAADLDEARVRDVCRRHDIPAWYLDAGAMLQAERPDLVHIVTPPATHAELIATCLDAGASVLCEKPMCRSLAELDAVERVEARSAGSASAVAQWRFGSAARQARRLIREGALGRPLVAVCNTLWYRPEPYYRLPGRGRWSGDGGGPAATLGIHLMDLSLWLLGEWEEVSAMAATLERPIEVDDVSVALVRFSNGALATMTNSALSPRQSSYLRLDLQRATLELETLYRAGNADWRLTLPDGAEDDTPLHRWRELREDVAGSHEAQLTALLDSLDRHERPAMSGPETRGVLELLTCMYKSASTGKTVRRGSVTPGDPFYDGMNGAAAASGAGA